MKAEAISSPVWRISKNGDPRASPSNCSAYFFVISSWGFSCSNLYLLPVILLLCFCSPEENLAVLSPITPPPAGDGNEVPSLPALPQALHAQLSHAHHLSHFMCSVAWPPLWPLLGSLQFANSCLVFRGPKPGHSAPHPPIRGVEERGRISSLVLLAALLLMQPKRQLPFTAVSSLTCCPPAPSGPVLQSCVLSRQPSLSRCMGFRYRRHGTWHEGSRQPFSAACPRPCPPAPPLWGHTGPWWKCTLTCCLGFWWRCYVTKICNY